MSDQTDKLAAQVADAANSRRALQITGGGSKAFYGRQPVGELLSLSDHTGVVNYEPTELIITARTGTPLREIEAVLADQGQMLPFEPPAFGDGATLGGTVACNLSGSRRPYVGSLRDFVLGCRLINGEGEVLHFGGEVMKNVAGYDVSRLQCGAMGTLGILLEVSLKVLPRPETELTLVREQGEQQAIDTMNRLGGQPYPLSAAAYDGNQMYLRLSGSDAGVAAASKQIGGDVVSDADNFWRQLDNHRLAFFDVSDDEGESLWRLSLSPATASLGLDGRGFIDWGGAQRWLRSELPAEPIRAMARRVGGHATLFRGADRRQPFQPLDAGLMSLHQRLKQSFDPRGIFNPGRMYEGI